MALSEVLFIDNCEPCDPAVLGDEEESGLLLCVCVDGLVVPLLSELVGNLDGGGLATGDCVGAKDGSGEVLSRFKGDGSGEVLSRFKGDGTGLEKFVTASVAIAGRGRRCTRTMLGFGGRSGDYHCEFEFL